MSTWIVTMPITGSARIEVEADTEEEAICAADDLITIDEVDWTTVPEDADAECVEEEE